MKTKYNYKQFENQINFVSFVSPETIVKWVLILGLVGVIKLKLGNIDKADYNLQAASIAWSDCLHSLSTKALWCKFFEHPLKSSDLALLFEN